MGLMVKDHRLLGKISAQEHFSKLNELIKRQGCKASRHTAMQITGQHFRKILNNVGKVLEPFPKHHLTPIYSKC